MVHGKGLCYPTCHVPGSSLGKGLNDSMHEMPFDVGFDHWQVRQSSVGMGFDINQA